MDEPTPSTPRSRAFATRVVAVVAVAGVIALVALIVRELFPHHAAARSVASGPTAPSFDVPAPSEPSAPVRARRSSAHQDAPVAVAAAPIAPEGTTKSPVAAVPLAAAVIAQVAANPEAFAPSRVFSPPAAEDQVYSYEPLPPFNSTTFKRTRKNPSAWELDAMRGPKMNDLGPEGGVRQAALVKDSIGNETPWYAIDSGPLAPAYAVMQGGAMRVMSRAFLVQNRASLPPEVASTLDK